MRSIRLYYSDNDIYISELRYVLRPGTQLLYPPPVCGAYIVAFFTIYAASTRCHPTACVCRAI